MKRSVYFIVKRILDIILSGTALVALSPFIIIILIIKFFEDFHNPVYISKRVGKGGKLFNFIKIRSMRPDAELLKQELINEGMNEVDGPAFKIKKDPRITRFGVFLRKWSLDEVLQLVNVFIGDMSIVGPRPPIPSEVEDYKDWHYRRLEVKGGLLCLWQIQPDRHSIDFDRWVQYDIEYIENMSLYLDFKIIFKGAYMIISGKSGD